MAGRTEGGTPVLNGAIKREALGRLDQAHQRYQIQASTAQNDAVALHALRKSTSSEIIQAAEDYVNTLANSPKAFGKSVSEFRLAIDRFELVVAAASSEAQSADIKMTASAGTAIGTGVGVAAFGPTAAMAVATTFGTASTGTAISALSGAAATKAALAWLGGGALAAGGGGMVAGKALLALAGPIGWGIGAASLAGTALWSRSKNAEIAEKARREADRIEGCIRSLQAAQIEIGELCKLTKEHADGVRRQLDWLRKSAPANYGEFSDQAKQELSAIINNIRSLAKLLNKQVA